MGSGRLGKEPFHLLRKIRSPMSFSSRDLEIGKRIEEFFFGPLLASFPERAFPELAGNFHKHLFEVSLILRTQTGGNGPAEKPNLLDVGGGMGINAILLSRLFGYECTVIDRYIEFLPEHKRVVGDKFGVAGRLKRFGVHVCERNFIEEGFPYSAGTFRVITCFDVVEHFNFSPKKLVTEMAMMLRASGTLLIGTPNQAHLYNRLKALIGKNTWEDFEYFYSAEHFFGHIREFIPDELEAVITREPFLSFREIVFSNYPVESRKKWLDSKIGAIPACLARTCVKILTNLFPRLNYYMVAISTKKQDVPV
jgi:SAM-dependent methyltransferase